MDARREKNAPLQPNPAEGGYSCKLCGVTHFKLHEQWDVGCGAGTPMDLAMVTVKLGGPTNRIRGAGWNGYRHGWHTVLLTEKTLQACLD